MLKHKSKARPVTHRNTPTHLPLNLRLFSSLAFWITLWSLMFIYFFIIDLLALIFGERLIPRLLLDTASLVKVCTIFTCFLYASFFAPKDYLLRFALLFTFLADIILLYNNISPIGVIIFCLAQYLHISRYASLNPKLFILWSIINLLILSPKYRRAALCNFFGFALFICCDLTVMISYFARIHILPEFLFAPANFICWLFYFPSQILLTNSSMMTTPYYAPFDSKIKTIGNKSKLVKNL